MEGIYILRWYCRYAANGIPGHITLNGSSVRIETANTDIRGIYTFSTSGYSGTENQNNGDDLTLKGGSAYNQEGNGNGGDVIIRGGSKNGEGEKGKIRIDGTLSGIGGTENYNNGENLTLTGGSAYNQEGNGNGGDVVISGGSKNGSGTVGTISLNSDTTVNGNLYVRGGTVDFGASTSTITGNFSCYNLTGSTTTDLSISTWGNSNETVMVVM